MSALVAKAGLQQESDSGRKRNGSLKDHPIQGSGFVGVKFEKRTGQKENRGMGQTMAGVASDVGSMLHAITHGYAPPITE